MQLTMGGIVKFVLVQFVSSSPSVIELVRGERLQPPWHPKAVQGRIGGCPVCQLQSYHHGAGKEGKHGEVGGGRVCQLQHWYHGAGQGVDNVEVWGGLDYQLSSWNLIALNIPF